MSQRARVGRLAALVGLVGMLATAGCSGGSAPAHVASTDAAPVVTDPGSPSAAPASATPTPTPVASPRRSLSPAPTVSPRRVSPAPTPRRTTAPPVIAHYAGRYAYPVVGCSSSPSSSHHDYPAADVFTSKGCGFVAVTAGRVDEVSYVDHWSSSNDSGAVRGGLSVSIVGDDGVRYYGSHLLRIAAGISPGARVHAGQLLGAIDNSGDAKYTPTHVHFGISWPTRPGVWWVRRGEVWPQRYLTAWREGRALSPAGEVAATHRRLGDVPPCQAEC